MRGSKRRATALLALCLLGLAGCGPSPTDTGFVGTWQRAGDGPSIISFREDPTGWHFRWSMTDGLTSVRCDASGSCEEFQAGNKAFDHTFTVRADPASSDLIVECLSRRSGIPDAPQQYTDRVVLETGGQRIRSTQIERNGRAPEPPPPPLEFVKIDDQPL